MANFQWERLIMALGAVASMAAVLERVADGATGGSRWRHAVAEIAVKHEASRCLTYHALRLFAAGHDAIREVTEAKLLSQRSALEVAESAFRILDGEPEIGRVLRDTRLGPIGGGTDEVMKEILGRQLGLSPRAVSWASARARRSSGEPPPRGRDPCLPPRPSGTAR